MEVSQHETRIVEERAKIEAELVRRRLERLKAAKYWKYEPVIQSQHESNNEKPYNLYFVSPSREREEFIEAKTADGSAHSREFEYHEKLLERLADDQARELAEETFHPEISEFAKQFTPRRTEQEIDNDIVAKRMERIVNDVPGSQALNKNPKEISNRLHQSIMQESQRLRERKQQREEPHDPNCTFTPEISQSARNRPDEFYAKLELDTKRYHDKCRKNLKESQNHEETENAGEESVDMKAETSVQLPIPRIEVFNPITQKYGFLFASVPPPEKSELESTAELNKPSASAKGLLESYLQLEELEHSDNRNIY